MRLILQIKYGGLGDHLFYSHIPRIAKETGAYKEVYISTFSEFRHIDNKKLIWDLNPYIDGFIDEPGEYPEFSVIEDGLNLLDKIMLELNLDDGKRFHEPEIYYQPKFKKEYNVDIYDPNYISYVGEISKFRLNFYMYSHLIFGITQMKIRSSKALNIFFNYRILETKSLEDFCDLIFSAKKIYCLTTGTATLAAALGKPVVVLYGKGHKSMFRHSLLHTFIKI